MIEKEEGNNPNMSCCGNESESITIAKKNNLCPVCEKQGTLVKNIRKKLSCEIIENIPKMGYRIAI